MEIKLFQNCFKFTRSQDLAQLTVVSSELLILLVCPGVAAAENIGSVELLILRVCPGVAAAENIGSVELLILLVCPGAAAAENIGETN